jgi:hypothetical protein
MKKIFYLILILSTFVGCATNHTSTHTNIQADHIDYITIDGYCTVGIYNIEYNGHEYLLFDEYESVGVEHNPDCKKCKSQSSYTPTEYLY